MINLRPYQEELIEKIRVEMRKGKKSILAVSPTGSGKTACFTYMVNGAKNSGKRVLVLAHRKEIIGQILKSFFNNGITAGQIAAGKHPTSDLVQVASVQTLIHRIGSIRRPDIIITDEAHHSTSPTYKTIHNYWKDSLHIGFSASPERLDGVGLGDCFESMVLGPSIKNLVADGWLAYPRLYRPPNEITVDYHLKRGDFDTQEQQNFMSQKSIVGDAISHYKKHMDGEPCIVSCATLEHAHLMATQFAAAGYRAKAVWGNMKDNEREYAINGLGNGNVQLVTFCDLIGEGVDVPILKGVILLRRTASLALYLQIVGRALRPCPGKTEAIILDHVGNWHLHGHVLADRDWSLESKKRSVKDMKNPETTACPQCFGIWPGKISKCPACGFEFKEAPRRESKPIEIIEGELIDAGLDENEAEQEAIFIRNCQTMDSKTKQKAILGRAFSLAVHGDKGLQTLQALAEAVGYKQGYARWAWDYVNNTRRKTG
jgi:superfamily II DNA or RNA helicase